MLSSNRCGVPLPLPPPQDVVHACSGGTLVVLDMGNCNPATRAWCIYEWWDWWGNVG